jgi:hypothetical protein
MKQMTVFFFVVVVSFATIPDDTFAGSIKPGKVIKIIKQAVAAKGIWDSLFGSSGVKTGTVIRECKCWGNNYEVPQEPKCASGYVQAVYCESTPSCVAVVGYYYVSYYQYSWICADKN